MENPRDREGFSFREGDDGGNLVEWAARLFTGLAQEMQKGGLRA